MRKSILLSVTAFLLFVVAALAAFNPSLAQSISRFGTVSAQRLIVNGDASIGGDLTAGVLSVVDGVVSLASDTFVYDTLGVTTTATITGDVTVGDDLTVGDLATVADLSVSEQITTDDITVADLATIADLAVTEQLTVTAGLSSDDLTASDDLTVGDLATIADLAVTEQLTVTGDATVGADVVVGKQTTIVVSDGSTITPLGTYTPISSTAATGTSDITAGSVAGQLLLLHNVGAQTITLTDTGTLHLTGNATMTADDSTLLFWDGAAWNQVAAESAN